MPRTRVGCRNEKRTPSRRNGSAVAATDRNRRRGRSCLLCSLASHERERFDRGLALGELSDAQVAREVGLHRANVGRHRRRHLLPSVAAAVPEQFDIVAEVRDVYARARQFLRAAEDTRNWPAAKAFIGESRAALELLGKMLVAAELTRPREATAIVVDISAEGPALDVTLPQLPARETAPVDEPSEEVF
jgi:hypothetical protein